MAAPATLSSNRGIVGRAFQLRRAQLVLDVRSDPDYLQVFGDVSSELAMPILFQGRTLGVLNFENDRPQAFSEETVSLLQMITDQIAGVVHLAAMNQRLSEMADELATANRRLHEMNRTLEELSAVDSLTGLANRRQFDRLLDLEWRRAIRGGSPLSLLFIDIDFFKRYNDTHGHLRGDAVLAEVAALLSAAVHAGRRPGRALRRRGVRRAAAQHRARGGGRARRAGPGPSRGARHRAPGLGGGARGDRLGRRRHRGARRLAAPLGAGRAQRPRALPGEGERAQLPAHRDLKRGQPTSTATRCQALFM